MLAVAAWIRAARGARARSLPPAISPIRSTRRSPGSPQPAQPAGETVARVFELAGFAKATPHATTLEELASAHLDILRKDGVASRARRSRNRKIPRETDLALVRPRRSRPLAHVRQAGATGMVTALHHLNDGRAWPADEIAKRKAEIEAAGLTWSVVESVIVHEDIKTRSGRYRELIDNYKASIRALAAAGIKTICYNFMAITDWTRTDLDYPMWHGGTALRFDIVDFCAYDVLVLKRAGAEADHPAERIEAARVAARRDERKRSRAGWRQNLIGWVPAREFIYDRESFRRALDLYRGHVGRRFPAEPVRLPARDRAGRRGGGRQDGDPSRRSAVSDLRPAARGVQRRRCGGAACRRARRRRTG